MTSIVPNPIPGGSPFIIGPPMHPIDDTAIKVGAVGEKLTETATHYSHVDSAGMAQRAIQDGLITPDELTRS